MTTPPRHSKLGYRSVLYYEGSSCARSPCPPLGRWRRGSYGREDGSAPECATVRACLPRSGRGPSPRMAAARAPSACHTPIACLRPAWIAHALPPRSPLCPHLRPRSRGIGRWEGGAAMPSLRPEPSPIHCPAGRSRHVTHPRTARPSRGPPTDPTPTAPSGARATHRPPTPNTHTGTVPHSCPPHTHPLCHGWLETPLSIPQR